VQQRTRTAAVHRGTSAPKACAAANPGIPPPVASTVTLPRPKAAAKTESYSVSVRNIPVQDLLFALARDAKLNVDIHPGINGVVTLNAIDQTLQQILSRIAKQVDMRWEIDGPNLIVMPDTPFLRSYKVDYVNIVAKCDEYRHGFLTDIIYWWGRLGRQCQQQQFGIQDREKPTMNSGIRSKRTSRTSCTKQTRSCRKDPAKPSSSARISRPPLVPALKAGQSAEPCRRSTNSLAGSPNAASLQQQGTTVVKRTTFREAASDHRKP
jgi:MSHA biogenesis protein MshL